jgi:hypothetical protein
LAKNAVILANIVRKLTEIAVEMLDDRAGKYEGGGGCGYRGYWLKEAAKITPA